MIGYICVVALCWKPKLSRLFMYASCFIWILVACYLANFAYSFQVCNTVQNKNFLFSGCNAFLENMTESKMFFQKLDLSECAKCVLYVTEGLDSDLGSEIGYPARFLWFSSVPPDKGWITSTHTNTASFLFTKHLALN